MEAQKKIITIITIIILLGLIIFAVITFVNKNKPKIGALLGQEIAEFRANTFNNETLESTEITNNQKNFILLNFFASWCGTCLVDHEYLLELANTNNLLIYGILVKDETKRAKKWLQNDGNPYDVVAIDKFYHIGPKFKLLGIPESFLIKDGIIIAHFRGPIDVLQVQEIIATY